MGVINVLDKHVAELIAAGEVVERPASVIKELVENSIDAGAKNITVEIKNGGTTFMRVADDGCGIYRDDIKVAFLRHATSKVKVESDLDSISTLGFRGEALASICAVSRLQLITRNVNEEIGTSYEIDGGEEQSFDDAGCPVGTTFVIRDLFYNIPARAKFLKKDVSEGNAVSNIIDKTALSHPKIAFTYIKDGKQVLRTFGDGKLISAIYSVFGKDFACLHLRRVCRRAERRNALFLQTIHAAQCQRIIRRHADKVHLLVFCQCHNAFYVRRLHFGNAACHLRNARVARRTENLRHVFRFAQFFADGMFAPAAADHQYLHIFSPCLKSLVQTAAQFPMG